MDTESVAVLYDMVENCCAVLRADPRVTAVCLVGSLARDEADANSDVDLCIFVSEGQLDSILTQASTIAGRITSVLVSGHIPNSTSYCSIYDLSGRMVKVDYDYFGVEQLPDMIMTGMRTRTYLFHHKLLYDRHGDVRHMLNTSVPRHVPAAPLPSIPFAISASSVVRMTRRGEFFEALDIMNHMRDPLLTSLLCRAFDTPFENYRRIESKLPDEIADWLYRTIAKPARHDVLNALHELINLYLHTSSIVGQEIGAGERRACDRVIEEIVRMLTVADNDYQEQPELPKACPGTPEDMP